MTDGDLQEMLRGMQPVLAPEPYGIAIVAALPAGLTPFATVAEAEGLTVIAPQAALEGSGIAAGPLWARISLGLQSELAAVGLTAAFSTALGHAGISANVIAGYHHDHILVQYARRHDAMAVLQGLADA